ncbi:MAG: arginine deiminase family protein [Dokdonella sp.]|uniref:dimethylarginine dimethylaminohydrolase family protein n=1 Tax=Dokdonella sp. TaxID=2291710 RepID=UPI003263A8C2
MIAITREVSTSLAHCELSFLQRSPIDVTLARAQHRAYQQALEQLGCTLVALPTLAEMPDAVFVEDVAIVTDEVAVMARTGAVSRRGEGASAAAALRAYRPVRTIEAPGTIDGGDVLRIGRRIFIGDSARTNADGTAQLTAILAPFGYTVERVPIRECLHLKSAVTALDDTRVLLQPAWVDASAFSDFGIVETDPSEEHAANVLRVGTHVMSPASFPRTHARLRAAGVSVVPVDVSEIQRAEGAVTCCSILLRETA